MMQQNSSLNKNPATDQEVVVRNSRLEGFCKIEKLIENVIS